MHTLKPDIAPAEALAACDLILASGLFTNAPRMSRLLRFLVEKAVSGAVHDTSEYAIGIEVFDRDATLYSTCDDPIVRVQVGRLRNKLKAYYAMMGVTSDIEISIPMGCYLPLIRRTSPVSMKHIPVFAIHPFKCISHRGDGESFTLGLHSELVHQLFKAFGTVAVAPTSTIADGAKPTYKGPAVTGARHQLEGSVQVDQARIRTSIRLIYTSTGCIAWSEQFNRNGAQPIELQEELASTICGALKRFYCQE